MGALRWILLLAGLLFLGILAAWESRRPRQGSPDGGTPERADRNEPTLGSLGVEHAAAEPLVLPPPAVRSRITPPPLIDLPPLEPELERVEPALEPAEPDVALDALEVDESPVVLEPVSAHAPVPVLEPVMAHAQEPAELLAASPQDVSVETVIETPPATDSEAVEPLGRPSTEFGEAPPTPAYTAPDEPPALIVEWPADHERHVITLRLVAVGEDRLPGRAVRQALAACGFVHGRFGIYHQPGLDGRALLSCASASKPGVFDPNNMDFQRYVGLSVFAVLPGPLPPVAALDHLLENCRELAARLNARLQDEQGTALDPNRLQALRSQVQALGATPQAEPAA